MTCEDPLSVLGGKGEDPPNNNIIKDNSNTMQTFNGGSGGNLPPKQTSIQVKKARTDQEPRIYKIMMEQMEDHHRYFAPVEKVQAVLMKSLSKHELKGKTANYSEKEYVRVTRREIGRQTLEERIEDYRKKLPSSTPEKIEDYYEHIVAGLLKLQEIHIVHFNIQPSNIIYSDSEYYPVITDFGQAFILEDLFKEETLRSVFSKPHPPNRCAEAICIAAIIGGDPEWKTKKVNLSQMEAALQEYFKEDDENVDQWKKYIQKLASKKEGKMVVDELLRNWQTWDLYSVNRIFKSKAAAAAQTIPGEPYTKIIFK